MLLNSPDKAAIDLFDLKNSRLYKNNSWARNYFDGKMIKYDNDPFSLMKLASFRRMIKNYVYILTKKNIPVKFNVAGFDSFTDHEQIIISARIPNHMIDVVVGIALHEASHIVKSEKGLKSKIIDQFNSIIPDDIVAKAALLTNKRHSEIRNYVAHLFNWVEDRRIDQWVFDTAPGYRGYYLALYKMFFQNDHINKGLLSSSYRDETLRAYDFRIINLINSHSRLDALHGLPEIWDILDIKNINRLKSSRDAFQVTLDVFETILKYVKQDIDKKEEAKKQNQSNNNSGETEEEKWENDDDLVAVVEQQEEAPGEDSNGEANEVPSITPDPDDESSDDNDEDDTGSNSGDDPSEDESDENTGSDKTSNDDSDAGVDENDDSTPKEDDSSGNGGSVDETDDNPNDDTDETTNQESTDSEETGDESTGGISKDETTHEDLTGDEESKLDKAIDKQKELINGTLNKGGLTQKQNNLLKSLEESNSTMEKAWKDYKGEGIDVLVVRNADQSTLRELCSWNEGPKYIDQVNKGIVYGQLLANKLQVRTESRTLEYVNMEFGDLDENSLHKASFSSKLFKNIEIEQYGDAVIWLTIDSSGSMGGDKWEQTIALATAIAKAASIIENMDVVISIRSTHSIGIGRRNKWGEYNNYSSRPFIAIVYDSRRDNFSKVMELFPHLDVSSETPEGLVFDSVMNEILKDMSGNDGYFINISDGAPHVSRIPILGVEKYYGLPTYRSETAYKHTKKMVDKLKANNIKVLSFFVGSKRVVEFTRKNFTLMYGNGAAFIDVENMFQVAHEMNTRLLSK